MKRSLAREVYRLTLFLSVRQQEVLLTLVRRLAERTRRRTVREQALNKRIAL